MDRDLVIVGSGAAGMVAAITAACRGLSVLVVEKSPQIGGTTSYSGGAGWLPLNPHMERIGVTDSREDAERYIRALTGDFFDAEMVGAYLDNTAAMVDELEENSSAVRFQPFLAPDYHSEVPGAAASARSLLPLPFDGRKLGSWLFRLRDAKPELTVLGGMQVDPAEAAHLQRSLSSWASLKVTLWLVSRYLVDKMRYGRGTRMIRGLALSARLLRSALDAGVEVWTDSVALRLVGPAGAVNGLIVSRAGREIEIITTRGVVLAAGGFGASREMMAEAIPFPETHISVLVDTNTGDGIKMAQAVGATYGPENATNAIWAPGSSRRRTDGTLATYPHFAFDRCKPGSIMVGNDGQRFANEAQSYHVLVQRMQQTGNVPAWLIGDHHFLRTYGMGMARPWPYPYRHLVREGYLVQAPTLAALAAKIGVPAKALVNSAERMNRFAKSGTDEDFGKGENAYHRSLGDPDHSPNPCLGPISRAPYYALALYSTDAGTTRGLRVDRLARVVDASGQPIAGLYAAGLDMHSPLRGFYPGAGTMIGPAMTFGYIAGRHAASELGPTG